MVKLWVSRVLDEPGNPVLATFRAARQALVQRLADERGLEACVECADEEEVELSVTAPLDEMVALLDTLWAEGLGNLALGAETEAEAAVLKALPAVSSVEVTEEAPAPACPPIFSEPRLGRVVIAREADAAASPELINEALEGHANFLDEQEKLPAQRRETASMLEIPDTNSYLMVETFGGAGPTTQVTLETYSESG